MYHLLSRFSLRKSLGKSFRKKESEKMSDEKINIAEKDLYCIAKLLQSSFFGENRFDGCRFCQYQCHVTKGNKVVELAPNYEKVIFRLQDITGVDFGICHKAVLERLKNDKSRCGDSDF